MAQDTFVRLYRYRKRYRPAAKLTTFLYLLARQVWIDALRRGGRRQAATEKLQHEMETATQPSPVQTDAVGQVEEALLALPETMRLVVVMSFYQGMKYDEIGKALGIPEGTVKSRMFHALRRMREHVHDEAQRG